MNELSDIAVKYLDEGGDPNNSEDIKECAVKNGVDYFDLKDEIEIYVDNA